MKVNATSLKSIFSFSINEFLLKASTFLKIKFHTILYIHVYKEKIHALVDTSSVLQGSHFLEIALAR